MSKLTLLYGGFWGSEGKGQVAVAIANRGSERNLIGVRVGGPNAGHTIFDVNSKMRKVQQIPVVAFVRQDAEAIIGASGLILPDVLERELAWLDEAWGEGNRPRLIIDKRATLITPEHMAREAELKGRIASTGEGVGAATADKVMRRAQTFEDYMDEVLSGCTSASPDVMQYIADRVTFEDTVDLLNWAAEGGSEHTHIVIEGTQGYLLSLNTSGYYPYTTSRDCGPEAILGQVGLSFRAFEHGCDIVAVMRTYPIRVGGNSGPMGEELTWEELQRRTGGYIKTPETTTVTGKTRRIAEWDWSIARRVVRETRPTGVALSFLDYLFPEANSARHESHLSHQAVAHIQSVEEALQTPVTWVSTNLGVTFPFTQHSNWGVLE